MGLLAYQLVNGRTHSTAGWLLGAVFLAFALTPYAEAGCNCPANWFWMPGWTGAWAISSDFHLSPDGRWLAWSVAMREDTPELVWSRLMVRERATGKERVLGETRFGDWGLLPIGQAREHARDTFHELCPIDWSPDGRKLLVSEDIGPLYTDVGEVRYWIFEPNTGVRTAVDLTPTAWAAAGRWAKKAGRDPRDIVDDEAVLGWHTGRTRRLVVKAFESELKTNTEFLGYWSVREEGSDPRLLAVREGAYRVNAFGRRLAVRPPRELCGPR